MESLAITKITLKVNGKTLRRTFYCLSGSVGFDIGFKHSVHAGQMALALGFEETQDIGINTQMYGFLIFGQDQFGVRPKIGAKTLGEARSLRGANLTARLHLPKLDQRRLFDIGRAHLLHLSTP